MQTAAQARERAADRIARDPLIGLPDSVIDYYANIYLHRHYSEAISFETFLRIALMLRERRS